MVKYSYIVTIEGPIQEDSYIPPSHPDKQQVPLADSVRDEILSNLESAYPYAESINVRLLATVVLRSANRPLEYIGLSGEPNGYLPTNHPNKRKDG